MNTFKQEFTLKYLKQDLSTSIAVFLVAVPLCLGIAHASGTPLLSGLIAGILGGLVVGVFSQSSLSVSGPAAGLTAIVASAAMELQSFSALLVAVFLAGLIQILLGVLKAGIIGEYIPSSVIRGMLAAIGIILILKQLPHLMGFDKETEGVQSFVVHSNELEGAAHSNSHEWGGTTFTMLWDAVHNMQWHIFLIGIAAIAVIVLWDKTLGKSLKMIPGSLLAVVVGTLLAFAYGISQQDLNLDIHHLVQLPRINSWSAFVEQTSFPDWSTLFNLKVYTIAFTLAMVASIETLLSVEAIDKLDVHKRHTSTNRELLAQGFGNSISGLVGGIPMTSVIVRSSVNQVSGAETKLSAIFHGVWLLLAVIFAAPLINLIPLASLAAVLIMTGLKLAHPSHFKAMYRDGWDQFVPFVVTIVAIVLSDLLIGVLIGLGVSSAFILYSHYKSEVVSIVQEKNYTRLIFAENITFLNKARIVSILDSIEEGSEVILDLSSCKFIDHDVVESIQDFRDHCFERYIHVLIESHDNSLKQMSSQRHVDRLKTLSETV